MKALSIFLSSVLFALAASAQAPQSPGTPTGLPPVMHFCAFKCMTLTLKNGQYDSSFQNGSNATVIWTVESFSPESVIIHRKDSSNFAPVFAGQISKEGGRLINVTMDGKPAPGAFFTWGDALNSIPGSNAERDRRNSQVSQTSSAPAAASSAAASQPATHAMQSSSTLPPLPAVLKFCSGPCMTLARRNNGLYTLDTQASDVENIAGTFLVRKFTPELVIIEWSNNVTGIGVYRGQLSKDGTTVINAVAIDEGSPAKNTPEQALLQIPQRQNSSNIDPLAVPEEMISCSGKDCPYTGARSVWTFSGAEGRGIIDDEQFDITAVHYERDNMVFRVQKMVGQQNAGATYEFKGAVKGDRIEGTATWVLNGQTGSDPWMARVIHPAPYDEDVWWQLFYCDAVPDKPQASAMEAAEYFYKQNNAEQEFCWVQVAAIRDHDAQGANDLSRMYARGGIYPSDMGRARFWERVAALRGKPIGPPAALDRPDVKMHTTMADSIELLLQWGSIMEKSEWEEKCSNPRYRESPYCRQPPR
jgi:hypothetical protein